MEDFYRCPFIANATNLKAMPDNPANYVDVFNNKNNLKNDIKRLIKVAKFFQVVIFVMADLMIHQTA